MRSVFYVLVVHIHFLFSDFYEVSHTRRFLCVEGEFCLGSQFYSKCKMTHCSEDPQSFSTIFGCQNDTCQKQKQDGDTIEHIFLKHNAVVSFPELIDFCGNIEICGKGRR